MFWNSDINRAAAAVTVGAAYFVYTLLTKHKNHFRPMTTVNAPFV
jgi:hypothetical protein